LQYLAIEEDSKDIKQVLEKYRPEKGSAINKGVHFNKGKIARYKVGFSDKHQKILIAEFGEYIIKMGYPID